ncbi:hypothetical protein EPYR_03742 [Erwinia pyrifoliae DSM 12163]|nr:hypothetical protein EJP617_09660 [Erwinia sp. Ejp617]CAY76122.1 hypothetical protein EPYR_03742 [Erwinia pyrifoliae DSM 12163]
MGLWLAEERIANLRGKKADARLFRTTREIYGSVIFTTLIFD